MNKMRTFFIFKLFAVMPLITEANAYSYEQTMSNNDSFSQENQNQNFNANVQTNANRPWETTTRRMNRQAGAPPSDNPQDREESLRNGPFETTSSRMNRQARDAANTRAHSSWNRDR